MNEITELSLDELQQLIEKLHLEDEFDLMEVGRCDLCCSAANGGVIRC